MNDTMTSRQRRKQETRQALLAAAHELFCRDGYVATTVDSVAQEAGFTSGAVYAHFPNKDEMFLELQHERMLSNTARGLAALPSRTTLERRLRALGRFLGELARDQHTWAMANTEFTAVAARRPELRERLAAVDTEALKDLAALVESALAPDVRLSPSALMASARQVTALLDGLTLQAFVEPDLDVQALLTSALLGLFSEQPAVRGVRR